MAKLRGKHYTQKDIEIYGKMYYGAGEYAALKKIKKYIKMALNMYRYDAIINNLDLETKGKHKFAVEADNKDIDQIIDFVVKRFRDHKINQSISDIYKNRKG
jgi:hypothetical protein